MKNDDGNDVAATIALALALWAGSVAAGTLSEVFVRVQAEAYATLVAFAIAFAAGVVTVDARVRDWIDARGPRVAWLALSGWVVVLGASAISLAVDAGAGSVAAFPWAPILLFGLPVSSALSIAALRQSGGGAGRRASTAPARGPVAPSRLRAGA